MKRTLILLVVLIGSVGLSSCSERSANEAATTANADTAATEKAREAAAASLEAERLAALWTYFDGPSGTDRQATASIYSTEGVDTDGQGPKRVQLVFRNHSSWGRSSYLVLQGGDFDCYNGCSVAVTADDAPAVTMAGRRPKTDEAIAMFIDDVRDLWRLTGRAKRLAIEFPVRAGGRRTAVFDVAGLDRGRMRNASSK